jgi:predicted phage tail protein
MFDMLASRIITKSSPATDGAKKPDIITTITTAATITTTTITGAVCSVIIYGGSWPNSHI